MGKADIHRKDAKNAKENKSFIFLLCALCVFAVNFFI
jgi:hypothetical protein